MKNYIISFIAGLLISSIPLFIFIKNKRDFQKERSLYELDNSKVVSFYKKTIDSLNSVTNHYKFESINYHQLLQSKDSSLIEMSNELKKLKIKIKDLQSFTSFKYKIRDSIIIKKDTVFKVKELESPFIVKNHYKDKFSTFEINNYGSLDSLNLSFDSLSIDYTINDKIIVSESLKRRFLKRNEKILSIKTNNPNASTYSPTIYIIKEPKGWSNTFVGKIGILGAGTVLGRSTCN